jgi:proline dehydrogenase
MKKTGKPVPEMEKAAAFAREFQALDKHSAALDFSNTEHAFVDKSNPELRKAVWLFKLMNNPALVSAGASLAMMAVNLRLPFFETLVRKSIFEQFCGGTSLLNAGESIRRLHKYSVQTVLDYGAEGKERESDFNHTMAENMRAIDFSSQVSGVTTISTKVTGLARFALLERVSSGEALTQKEKDEFQNVVKRVDSICHAARNAGVRLFIDAEESWIQPAIDKIANQMMKRYNREGVVVYNTFQLYRSDRLAFLMESFDRARRDGYMLGAKLVRGAYMDKERKRAEELGNPSPIQPNKAAADQDYNLALRFCIDNYTSIACCNASHNMESNSLMASLIDQKGLQRNHPHLMFCQLYGMSDNITFNLAAAGYNVAKYVVYGQVRDVVPYLIRRTRENTSITGDLSRELQLHLQEARRRGL